MVGAPPLQRRHLSRGRSFWLALFAAVTRALNAAGSAAALHQLPADTPGCRHALYQLHGAQADASACLHC